MSEDDQSMGERRRRREAERAAREASEQRPLTRRELRARETALQTGAIEIDATGAVHVIQSEEAAAEPDSASTPADPAGAAQSEITDTAGLSRRQVRELRARQEAAAASSAAEPTPARGISTPTPTPAPTPPIRRPVVRPPATTGAMRSLAADGTGLTPVVRDEPHQPKDDPTSTGSLSAVEVGESIDVTDVAMPAVKEPVEPATHQPDAARSVAAPGPLPTTRRSRRVAAQVPPEPESAVAAPDPQPARSLDEVIAGESDEPERFDARPSWVELPPPTPAAPLAALPAEQPAAATEASAAAPQDVPASPASAADDPDDDDDDDGPDEDEHRTPVWLSALMVLVLVVIGVVLGLLVWKMITGDGSAGADAIRSVTSALALKGWMT